MDKEVEGRVPERFIKCPSAGARPRVRHRESSG
jgi:hypothetical protein